MSLKTNVLITATALVALAAGAWFSSLQQHNEITTENENALAQARKNFSPIQGVILSPARKIAVPALIKDNKKTFTLNDLTGHWSLLYFGYTHCPDICPLTMGVLAQAKKSASAINHIFPKVFFISVDPKRDKVDMLADYVQYFDKDFTGVTGKKALINALALQLSVVYIETPTDSTGAASTDGDSYNIDHSSALLLFNPKGKLVAFFNPPHNPETILKDFQTVVNLGN